MHTRFFLANIYNHRYPIKVLSWERYFWTFHVSQSFLSGFKLDSASLYKWVCIDAIPLLLSLTEEMPGLSEPCSHPMLQGGGTKQWWCPGGILASPVSHLAQTARRSMALKLSSQHTDEKIPGTFYK